MLTEHHFDCLDMEQEISTGHGGSLKEGATAAHRMENYLHGTAYLMRQFHHMDGHTETSQLKAKLTPSWKMGKESEWQFLF